MIPHRTSSSSADPGVAGGVRLVLRLEGLAAFFVATALYWQTGYGWGVFALGFFVPDLAIAAYLAGNRIGAIAYNCTHSFLGAVLALLASVYFTSPELFAAGLIWCAHIGFDRTLGYGLKYTTGFAHTHLGGIGRGNDRAPATASTRPTDLHA